MAIKVLIVDDNDTKLATIQKVVAEAAEGEAIEIAKTVVAAKKMLQANTYDLLILDIALPIRDGEEPAPWAGIELLKEVHARDVYNRPAHIIGLTSYADLYGEAADDFSKELWFVLLYDPSSELWAEQLRAKIRYLRGVSAERADQTVDLCIPVALGDPELDAILRLDWDWKRVSQASDATDYFRGVFTRCDGTSGVAVAAKAASMGMPSAAVLATKMAVSFKPRLMVMTGICAGDSEATELGDLVVGNPVWDYGSGKHSVEGDEPTFEPAIYQLPLSPRVRTAVERLAADNVALAKIAASYTGQRLKTALRLHIGPMASGAAVLADEAAYKVVKKQHRKLIGIDMEAYAVMLAGFEAPAPPPETLVIKGVQDFADKAKDNKVRHYAAHVSAQALAALIVDFGA